MSAHGPTPDQMGLPRGTAKCSTSCRVPGSPNQTHGPSLHSGWVTSGADRGEQPQQRPPSACIGDVVPAPGGGRREDQGVAEGIQPCRRPRVFPSGSCIHAARAGPSCAM